MSKASTAAKSGATVTIACKLPHGLNMRVFKFIEGSEPVMGGGVRTTKQAVQDGPSRLIHGCAVPFGEIPRYKIVGGYALTEGVPKEFWETYAAQNADQEIIQNHLVFAYDKFVMAEGDAEEHSSVKSGLQPLQIDSKGQVNDLRAGKRIQTEEGNLNHVAQLARQNSTESVEAEA